MEQKEHICCICGKKFVGYGNNPSSLRYEGVCCNECNIEVIKARVDEWANSLGVEEKAVWEAVKKHPEAELPAIDKKTKLPLFLRMNLMIGTIK